MVYTYDHEASGRRLTAYTHFLMAAYDTDADGLADIANVRREDMAEYIDCCTAGDYDDLNCTVLAQLGNLTRISFSWLFAEEPDAEHEADGGRLGAAAQTASADKESAPKIDPDDFTDAVSKVKGCAAIMSALYIEPDASQHIYRDDMFSILNEQLHAAAEYFGGVLETL